MPARAGQIDRMILACFVSEARCNVLLHFHGEPGLGINFQVAGLFNST